MAEKIKISFALLPNLDPTKEYEVECKSKDYTQLTRFLNKAASAENVEITSFETKEYDFTAFCPITGQFVKPGLAGYKLAEYGIKVNVSFEELARIYRYNKEYFVKQIVKMVLSKSYKLERGCKSLIILAITDNIELINYNDYKYVNFNKLNTNSESIINHLKDKLFIEKENNLYFKYETELNKYQVRTLLTIFRNIFFIKDKEDIEIDNTDEDCGPILENEAFREDKLAVYRNIYSCKFNNYKQIVFDCTKLPVRFNGSFGSTTKTVITNKYFKDGQIVEEKIVNSKTYKGGDFLEDFIYYNFKDKRFTNVKTDIRTRRYNKVINNFSDEEKMLMQLTGTTDMESAKWLIENGMINESLPVTVLLNLADELELTDIRKNIEEKIKSGLMPEPSTQIEYFGNQIYFEDEVNASSEEIDEE